MQIGKRMSFGELSTRTATGITLHLRHSARSVRAGAVLAPRLLRSSLLDCAHRRGLSIGAAEAFGSTKGTAARTAENACRQAAHTRCQLQDGQSRDPRVQVRRALIPHSVRGARARACPKRRRRRESRRRARGTAGDSLQQLRARNKRKSARLSQRQHRRSQPCARRTPTSTGK